jgi:peroxiredoxin
MPKKVLLFFLFFSSLFILHYSLFIHAARAAISACSASVGPSSQNTNSSGTLVFSVTNNDQSNIPIQALTITAPSNNFTITSATGTYAGAVEISSDGLSVTIRLNGWLQPGEIGDYSVDVTTGASAMAAGSFAIQASDTFDGVTYTGCLGDTNVSITSPGQATINITNATVSVADTKAIISWNTSVNTTGEVDYGTTDQYGSVATDSNSGASHSMTLTGLSSSTTYHYRIFGTDVNGVTAQTVDNSFTTAAAGTTTTTTVTVTTTTTTSAKVVSDTTGPSVSISTDFSKPFKLGPEISGVASDPSRVVKIEYSIDGGVNWLPGDSGSLGEKTAKFTFTPDISDDGNYKIVARAMDGAGNHGVSRTYTLIIDRLPPLVGGNVWSLGPILLNPDVNGFITTLTGVDNKITMSAVGGPLSIDLSVGSSKYSLEKSVSSGLWTGTINFKDPGLYTVSATSVDGAGNVTQRDLNTVLVLTSGSVTNKKTDNPIGGATLGVYELNPASKLWNLWTGASFGQTTTQTTDVDGGYSYFLPAGTYYLRVSAPGYKDLYSNIFKLDQPSVLNANFRLKPLARIQVGPFSLALPDFTFDSVEIAVNTPKVASSEENKNALIGTAAPDFILPDISGNELNSLTLRGKSRILIFVNTWLPQTSEQISQVVGLDQKYRNRISFIVTEESVSRASVFAKRGEYQGLTVVVDADGTLVTPYKINGLPSSYFVDKKGIIQKITSGVVTGSDIMNYIDNN